MNLRIFHSLPRRFAGSAVTAMFLAIFLAAQLPAEASDRKTVQWTFPTSEAAADIAAKLRAFEGEITRKYNWQVKWQASDVLIQGKLFDARLKCLQGNVCVRIELGSGLAAFESTIRRAFEKELRKHLALL